MKKKRRWKLSGDKHLVRSALRKLKTSADKHLTLGFFKQFKASPSLSSPSPPPPRVYSKSKQHQWEEIFDSLKPGDPPKLFAEGLRKQAKNCRQRWMEKQRRTRTKLLHHISITTHNEQLFKIVAYLGWIFTIFIALKELSDFYQ